MTSEVPTNTAFDLLKTKTRRQAVTLLLEVEGTWGVEELAAELVRLDPTVAPDGEGAESHAERVATRLYHCALPKLAEEDVVDFDREEMTTAPGEHLAALGAHLDDSLSQSNTAYEEIGFAASV